MERDVTALPSVTVGHTSTTVRIILYLRYYYYLIVEFIFLLYNTLLLSDIFYYTKHSKKIAAHSK